MFVWVLVVIMYMCIFEKCKQSWSNFDRVGSLRKDTQENQTDRQFMRPTEPVAH